MRFVNCSIPLSETRRKACAVRSLVASFVTASSSDSSAKPDGKSSGVRRTIPDAVLKRELLVDVADLGQDAQLKVGHGEQELRVVLRVDADVGIVPLDRGERPRETVLDVPLRMEAVNDSLRAGGGCGDVRRRRDRG